MAVESPIKRADTEIIGSRIRSKLDARTSCHQRVGVHLSQIRGIAIYLALRLVPY